MQLKSLLPQLTDRMVLLAADRSKCEISTGPLPQPPQALETSHASHPHIYCPSFPSLCWLAAGCSAGRRSALVPGLTSLSY